MLEMLEFVQLELPLPTQIYNGFKTHLDISDFVRAWLLQRQYRDTFTYLKSYHGAAYEAFSKAFGIDLNLPPDKNKGFPDENGMHGLFLNVASSCENVASPFSFNLEAHRGVVEMYQKFGNNVEEAAGELRQLYLAMMVEMAERIWGRSASHSVNQQELEALWASRLGRTGPV